MLLAIDTCFDGCSAAALNGDVPGRFAASESFQMLGQGHAERLASMIQEVMGAADFDFGKLTRIGVTVGPGTFTGVRIGVAVARGLALATGARVVGISSLLAMGWRALQDSGDTLPPSAAVLVCMDARRGEVYCQLIDRHGAALSEPLLLSVEEAAARFLCKAKYVTGSGAEAVAAARQGQGGKAEVLPIVSSANLAGAMIGRLAGLAVPDERPRPLYLRPADAKPQAGANLRQFPG
jgi:tRNA threonylcarbamoyladenosine biosynthesis protein TsaB